MALATISVVLGLDTGIKRLSEINIVLAMLLLLLILLTGPTALLLAGTLQNLVPMWQVSVPRTLICMSMTHRLVRRVDNFLLGLVD